jgi:large conductance mechanosensitive channel
MRYIEEFKAFAVKGNVVDLAVGVIIGGAFGKIVTSLVNDVVMPLLSLLIAGVNFNELTFVLKDAAAGGTPVVIKYGAFIQSMLDFLIIALAIFAAIKVINRLRFSEAQLKEEPAPVPEDVRLLTEIRDELRKRES